MHDDLPSPYRQSVEALDAAHRLAREFVGGLRERPVGQGIDAATLSARFDAELPTRGCQPEQALAEWFAKAEDGIVASPGPRFFGFVNGGSTPAALAGDWLASAIDQNAGFWLSSPAAAETERNVIGWLRQMFDLPDTFFGVMTSGGTFSNLVGLAAGRQWVGRKLGFNPALDGLSGQPPIRVISSTEIHASAVKSLGTLGIGRGSVEKLPAIDGALDLNALREALATRDVPALVVANAGDVNTGAFDDIVAIAEICRAHAPGVWLHVDGAFGLFARVSPRFADLGAGIELADSVAADGHKWLNVPYDAGFVFVRDREMLDETFSAAGAYLAPTPGSGWDPASNVPEMSRRFRALAAWCALRSWGRSGYREMIERCIDNAQTFGDWVEGQAELELMAPVPLNIVCFRYTPNGLDDEATDDYNRAAVGRIRADGRAFVTGTIWNGRAALRAAFDNWATTTADVRILQAAIADMVAVP